MNDSPPGGDVLSAAALGFMRAAVISPEVRVADVDFNVGAITRALAQAGVSTDAQSFSFSAQTQDGQRGRQQTQPQFATADVDGTEPAPQDYRKLHTRGSLNLIA